jgi:two-component system sensor histidine kinase/response regulator
MDTTSADWTQLHFQEYTIFIVDDNPTNIGVLFEYLEKFGFDLVVARDGESGIQRAQQSHPDLVLLDVMMPGIDGFETCRRLKTHEATKDIPVIFMTALTSPEEKVKGFQAGGVDYITKPFQQEEVLARVATHLRIRTLQQQLELQNTVLQAKNIRLEQAIAERKKAEEKLKEVNQQLQAANASKDKFFSMIAHDLRSPFTALLGLSEVVIRYIDDYSKEEIKDNMLRIRKSSEAVYNLLENLLTWSRLQRGLMDYHPATISLDEIVEHNVYLFKSSAEQKQITLKSLVPEEMTAYADNNMIDTVIRNLIANALKFTYPGGTIDVLATVTEDFVEMAVADTGTGISQEDLPKLFRLDTQYMNIGTVGEKGTGLGLSLCKDLIEKNGGTIWVESEVGKGTTFRFTLPKMRDREGTS